MSLPIVLDLCCCEGGAGEGYRQAGFRVVGVDVQIWPNMRGEIVIDDAIGFAREHAHRFDAIHASPPCHKHMNNGNAARVADQSERVDLIDELREILVASGKPWIIENVLGAPLRRDLVLCGTMFGLEVQRHRAFEIGGWEFDGEVPPCDHTYPIAGVYGNLHGKRGAWPGMLPSTLEVWRRAMGIPWGSAKGLTQAIPPAYTKLIGDSLMSQRWGVSCAS